MESVFFSRKGVRYMIAVFLGGALGSLLRVLCMVLVPGFSSGFPLATLLVNWVGSAGIAWAYLNFQEKTNVFWKLFWMTGFFGGFTTMSIFSVETWELIQSDRLLLALTYILLTFFGSVGIVKWIFIRGGQRL